MQVVHGGQGKMAQVVHGGQCKMAQVVHGGQGKMFEAGDIVCVFVLFFLCCACCALCWLLPLLSLVGCLWFMCLSLCLRLVLSATVAQGVCGSPVCTLGLRTFGHDHL